MCKTSYIYVYRAYTGKPRRAYKSDCIRPSKEQADRLV